MHDIHPLSIDLRHAARQSVERSFELDDAFFAGLDQDEIQGGHVKGTLRVEPLSADAFGVRITATAELRVVCDRCLDELIYDVDIDEQMQLRYGNPDDYVPAADDDADVRIIPETDLTADLSWDLYEFLELALPLQRTHDEGDCNPDMLRLLS